MSASEQFEQQIDSYVNQMSSYNEQLNDYKDQLLSAKGQAADLAKSLSTEVAVPIAAELVRSGATKLFGAQVGDQVGRLAGSSLKTLASGDQNSVLANMRASLNPEAEADTADATEAESALNNVLGSARSGVMSAINRIKTGAADAVGQAEGSIEDAQQTLTNAAGDLFSSVTNRISSQASDLVSQQVARLNAFDTQGIIKSALTSSDFPTGTLGDIEMSNMASAVTRSGVPDLSLSFESTYEAPLLLEPMSIPGLSSNIIGRVIAGAKQLISPEIPDSVVPSQEEALSMISQQIRPVITSDLLPQGAGDIVGTLGRATDLTQTLGETVGGLAETASSTISGLSETAASVLQAAKSTVGETIGEAVGEAGAEAGAEVAAGAAAGPVGLIVGGLIAVGQVLYDAFHHGHSTAPVMPVMPNISLPSFQPGLGTQN